MLPPYGAMQRCLQYVYYMFMFTTISFFLYLTTVWGGAAIAIFQYVKNLTV